MNVYAYRNCSTCRKAAKWLEARNICFTELPIRETPPTATELKRVLKAYDGDLKRLFNTSGGDYKAMNMKDRLPGLSVDEAITLLTENGNLCKRPLVVGKGVALVGFKENEWETVFG